MTNAKIPPVPPANRSPAGGSKAGGATPGGSPIPEDVAQDNIDSKNRKIDQQGRQGNINQNTHNVGYQQDR
ncbi:hypothetical protein [Falsiroseomonas sp. HC035]|uniref:hypothetical protein n=1 Tax=unclassified Falsiroseomonas TaxID=2870720 RepID=UPI003D31CD54